MATAGCLGALATIIPEDELIHLINTDTLGVLYNTLVLNYSQRTNEHKNIISFFLVSDATVEWTLRHGRALTLSALFYDCSHILHQVNLFKSLIQLANNLSTNDRVRIKIVCLVEIIMFLRKRDVFIFI